MVKLMRIVIDKHLDYVHNKAVIKYGGMEMEKEKFNFEQFKGVGSKLSNYSISITTNGSFGLNSGFYNTEKIKDYSYVMLFYDKNRKTIGFLFTNTKSSDKGTFKITHGNNSGYIGTKTFFMSIFHGDLDEVKKYVGRYTPKTYDDEKIGKLFYITLKEEETNTEK